MAQMDNFSSAVQSQSALELQQMQQAQVAENRAGARSQILDMFPGIAESTGILSRKYVNTVFKGGFLDLDQAGVSMRSAAGYNVKGLKGFLGRRTGAYAGNAMQDSQIFRFGKSLNIGETVGSKFYGRMGGLVSPFRFDSVSRLGGGTSPTIYTPFQGLPYLFENIKKGKNRFAVKARRALAEAGDVSLNAEGMIDSVTGDKPLYAGGVFGRVMTMGKVQDYEKAVQAASGLRSVDPAVLDRAQRITLRRADKAAAKLEKFDQTFLRLGKQVNAPYYAAARQSAAGVEAGIRAIPGFAGTFDAAAVTDEFARSAIQSNRIRAVAESNVGLISGAATDYFGVMMGEGSRLTGTRGYEFARKSISNLYKGVDAADDAAGLLTGYRTAAGTYGRMADDVLTSGTKAMRSKLGSLAGELSAAGEKKMATKALGHYAATYAKPLGTAFSAVSYASLFYDIGKGVGNMIMGGVNFAKDAAKSFQGSINKPVFGAGYRDNEVAATSRSRGVMAIQNSRLNARSTLGSEASMMAAHFG